MTEKQPRILDLFIRELFPFLDRFVIGLYMMLLLVLIPVLLFPSVRYHSITVVSIVFTGALVYAITRRRYEQDKSIP